MAKETAFGRDSDYQTFALLGQEIGQTRNKKALANQIQFLTSDNIIDSQRAATVLHHASNLAPDLFLKHLDKLIAVIENPIHDSGPRMVMRVCMHIEIPEKHSGTIVNLAFQYLGNPKTPVAIKVNAMYVIANQANKYPELTTELKACIVNQYERELPAFKSCVRKLSKQLNFRI
ncbi:hypothetical protein G3O08_15100 [Cryomorpha ignava]|uniref:HEAT repeat domain-containing protein n=1 Tax=Cryomorpha ignava TaxID=101383 RepID=A0A7K3WTF3_9FLAO|nr:hypothetical protein [Cryomorpha ignava]NEN24828.1 hypothetical protein [Cryomorpha ignava]